MDGYVRNVIYIDFAKAPDKDPYCQLAGKLKTFKVSVNLEILSKGVHSLLRVLFVNPSSKAPTKVKCTTLVREQWSYSIYKRVTLTNLRR